MRRWRGAEMDDCTCPLVWDGSAREPQPDPKNVDPDCPVHFEIPPHIDVYVTGIAKCWRCGERLCGWEDNELREWVDEHSHDEESEDDDG